MRVRALYAGKAFSIIKKEIIEYAIINEKDTSDVDIAILSREPTDGIVKFANPVRKWLESTALEVRDRLLMISGILRRAIGSPDILRLDDVRVEKAFLAKDVAEALIKKGEELAKVIDEKGYIKKGENVVEINNMKFVIARPTACSSADDVTNTLLRAYDIVSTARKRVFVASPVFIELTWDNNTDWYVVTLPRVLHFMRENPEAVVQAGIIDPEGFRAPYFIVTDMVPQDLGDFEVQRSSAVYLCSIIFK